MPQLDKVTFLSQFFWLCFFYLGFYILILKYFLPKMSRIIKLRKKKLSSSQEGVTSVQQENKKIRSTYDTLLANGFSLSRSLFNTSFHRTEQWLHEKVLSTNQMHSQAMNKAYIYSIGETSLSQNLALAHVSNAWSHKLFILYLVKKLELLKNFQKQKQSFEGLPSSAKSIKPLKNSESKFLSSSEASKSTLSDSSRMSAQEEKAKSQKKTKKK